MSDKSFALMFRLPGWANNRPVPSDLYTYLDNTSDPVVLYVNGIETAYEIKDGYMVVHRTWNVGDVVSFRFPMKVHHVVAHESVADDQGKVALERGPIVYCLEGIDNEEQVFSSIIGDEALITSEMDNSLFSSTGTELMTLSVNGGVKVLDDDGNVCAEDYQFTAIPYYAWANRGSGSMAIWLPRTADKAVVSDINRIVDAVDAGDSDSEEKHSGMYTSGSNTGTYANETWRDTPGGGFVQYVIKNVEDPEKGVSLSLRFTTNDAGREALVTIDGEPLTTVAVPTKVHGSNSSGMYDVEIPIPLEMLFDENGMLKETLTVRITSTKSNLSIPGLFYLRLLSPTSVREYEFVATEWISADSNRILQSNISYNEDDNTLSATPNSGNYNLALTLDLTTSKDYVVIGKKYLVVKGKNISLTPSDNVLWRLNGINQGSSVAATEVFSTESGEVVVAWDLSSNPLNANCNGEWWDIFTGMTCFGLTSTSGTSTISYIGFDESLDSYKIPTGIEGITVTGGMDCSNSDIYNLQGYRIGPSENIPGIYIVGGKKVLLK